jgi:hypothetical protein
MTPVKKVLVILLALKGVQFAWAVYFEGHQRALEERFPNVDPSIARKVHKEMFREGLRGNYADMNGLDEDEYYDKIFLEKVERLTPKKWF